MKKAASSSSSSSSSSGPSLTPSQRVARDLGKARKYLTKAAGEKQIAAGEAKLGHRATAARDMVKVKKDLANAVKYKLKAARVGYARPVDVAAINPASSNWQDTGVWSPRSRFESLGRSAWISGRNDLYPACAAAAVANSLLAVTGHRVTDTGVLALHEAAGDETDAPRWMADVLHELLAGGLAGIRPRTVRPVPVAEASAGAVAVVLVPGWQPHAVTLVPGGVATWGGLGPAQLLEHAAEAWAIDW